MEFITNFIKRPMSLVLSDAGPNSTTTTTTTATANSSSTQSDQTVGKGEVEPAAAVAAMQALATLTTTNGTEAHSTSPAKNLDEAITATTADLEASLAENVYGTTGGDLTMLPPIVDHSPLSNKSAGATNKTLTPPTPTPTTPTFSSRLNKTPNNTFASTQSGETTPLAAAVTANLEQNNSVSSLEVEADGLLTVDLFGNSRPKRLSTKFVELKEFNESDLPDLPDELDPEFCEDPLKLSFSEGVPRSLSADSTATFDLDKTREANSAIDVGNLLTVNETDTAFSSDNETYAECQSYRDSELNYEYPLETSNAEHYQSAFNTHENTFNCDQMNATFDNKDHISPILNEDHLVVGNLQAIMMNASNEPEPMDVDMNSTLEMSNNSLSNTTVEADYSLKQQSLSSNKTTPEKSDESIKSEENLVKPTNSLEQLSEHAVGQTNVENSQVATTQDSKEAAKEHVEFDTNTAVAASGSNVEIVTENSKSKSSTPPLVVALPLAKASMSPVKLDVSTRAAEGDENLPLSPSFPLKSKNDTLKFPASPTQKKENHSIFLEPSLMVKSPSPDGCTLTASDPNFPVESNNKVVRSLSPTTNTLNATFDGNVVVSPAADMPSDGSEPNFNKEKRRTFDVASLVLCNKENTAENSANAATHAEGSEECTTNIANNLALNEANNRRSLNFTDKTLNASNDEQLRTFNLESATATAFHPYSPIREHLENEIINCRTFDVLDKTTEKLNDEQRRTFNLESATAFQPYSPIRGHLENEAINRRTFCLSDKTIENLNDEQRRTFNIATPTVLQHGTPVSEQAKDETKSCHTFNLSDNIKDIQNEATATVLPLSSLATEQLKQLNETTEAMEVDESFTVPSTEAAPKSPPLPAQREQHQQQITLPLSPFKGSSSLSIVLNTSPTLCSSTTVAAAKILSKSPPLLSKISTLGVQEAFMMPPPARKLSPEKNKRSSLNEVPAEILSEKEQTKSDSKDEKDIFVEKFAPSPLMASILPIANPFSSDVEELLANEQFQSEFSDEDFKGKIVLQPSDFDYLLTKGSSNEPVDRSSLLLRFDPLVGPVLANNAEKQQENLQRLLQKVTGAGNSASSSGGTTSTRPGGNGNEKSCLKSQTIQEEQAQVQGDSNNDSPSPSSYLPVAANTLCAKAKGSEFIEQLKQQKNIQTKVATAKRHANMSVDVIKDINNIDNDCTKNNYELSNSQSDEKQSNYKMDELEKKIKNEVLKTEDIAKKLKEAEQREEALIKRITEKDKQILKMSNVTESYEKSIAELIAEKEQLVQNYEKQLTEVSADRDSNYRHLMSLETTFSDLHVKYEKSKEMTSQLKTSEEALLAEKRQNLENLHKQEQRYEKMKYHAMQQLDIANKKLESMKKEYAVETTKLKAQLKKEEISRASLNEQLQQKTRENQELVKICDELISGQGS